MPHPARAARSRAGDRGDPDPGPAGRRDPAVRRGDRGRAIGAWPEPAQRLGQLRRLGGRGSRPVGAGHRVAGRVHRRLHRADGAGDDHGRAVGAGAGGAGRRVPRDRSVGLSPRRPRDAPPRRARARERRDARDGSVTSQLAVRAAPVDGVHLRGGGDRPHAAGRAVRAGAGDRGGAAGVHPAGRAVPGGRARLPDGADRGRGDVRLDGRLLRVVAADRGQCAGAPGDALCGQDPTRRHALLAVPVRRAVRRGGRAARRAADGGRLGDGQAPLGRCARGDEAAAAA